MTRADFRGTSQPWKNRPPNHPGRYPWGDDSDLGTCEYLGDLERLGHETLDLPGTLDLW